MPNNINNTKTTQNVNYLSFHYGCAQLKVVIYLGFTFALHFVEKLGNSGVEG